MSLAIGANVVRVLDEKGVRVRELPLLTGVSKEAIAMALGFLRKRHLAVIEPNPAGGRTERRSAPPNSTGSHRGRLPDGS